MTTPPTVGRRRANLALLAVSASAAMAVLTGCAGLHPGAAAVVGSETITHEQVDDLAEALCSANVSSAEAQGQAATELPTRGARESALQVLLDTAFSQQFGVEEGVEPDRQQVSQALAQNEQGVALLPEDQREGFREVLKEYAEAQLTLIAAGRLSLESSGQQNVSDDQAIAEGQRLRGKFVEDLEIEVDPRFGSFSEGTVQPGAASLSVPVSSDARAGARAQPAPDWVKTLPATQKCS